jgi:hypothetical protein
MMAHTRTSNNAVRETEHFLKNQRGSAMNDIYCICELSEEQIDEVSGGYALAVLEGVALGVGLGIAAYYAGHWLGSHAHKPWR